MMEGRCAFRVCLSMVVQFLIWICLVGSPLNICKRHGTDVPLLLGSAREVSLRTKIEVHWFLGVRCCVPVARFVRV